MKPIRRVYHLAEAANWDRIQQEGLLSASTLFTQAGITGSEPKRIKCAQRNEHTTANRWFAAKKKWPVPSVPASGSATG